MVDQFTKFLNQKKKSEKNIFRRRKRDLESEKENIFRRRTYLKIMIRFKVGMIHFVIRLMS